MCRTSLQLLLLAIAAAPVRAQLIDQQPHNTGGPGSDTAFVDLFGREVWQLVADDFVVSSDSAVRRISWWGFFDQDNPPATETMRIRIHSARPGDGLPGDVIYEQLAINPTRTWTGRRVGVTVLPREFYYQFNLPTLLQLTGQTRYWLEIVQIGDLSTAFRWEFSVSDNSRHAYINPMVAEWQYPQGNGDLAFQLTPVPEPPVICFLSAVAFIATAIRRNPS